MIHVFNYRDKNYIYDVGSGSLHECDKPTADYLKAQNDSGVDITYISDEQLKEAGVAPDLIRLSVGIEDANDIIADLEQAMQNI